MIPKNRLPSHPGEILRHEFLIGKMTQRILSIKMGVSLKMVSRIVNCHRGITADTALRLSRVFGGNPWFWMNLQANYDLAVARKKLKKPKAKR